MPPFFATLLLLLKGASVRFAAIIPAMVGFHLVGRFVYHSTSAWLPGCAVGLGIAAALWLWIFSRAEEPWPHTLSTLLISTTLWFCFFIGIFRAGFILDHHVAIGWSDALIVILSGAAVLWLRHILIRRSRQVDHPRRRSHLA
jgi:hypothetical protein